MVGSFTYGTWRFPDNPIHPCAKHGYCGKQGQPRSVADYEAYVFWRNGMSVLGPLGVACLVILKASAGGRPAK